MEGELSAVVGARRTFEELVEPCVAPRGTTRAHCRLEMEEQVLCFVPSGEIGRFGLELALEVAVQLLRRDLHRVEPSAQVFAF